MCYFPANAEAKTDLKFEKNFIDHVTLLFFCMVDKTRQVFSKTLILNKSSNRIGCQSEWLFLQTRIDFKEE